MESEDDGWPGQENHWCPLLDLSYHHFIGRSLLGVMEEMDLASLSTTCQFAMFIAPVERETATKHVLGGQIDRQADTLACLTCVPAAMTIPMVKKDLIFADNGALRVQRQYAPPHHKPTRLGLSGTWKAVTSTSL